MGGNRTGGEPPQPNQQTHDGESAHGHRNRRKPVSPRQARRRPSHESRHQRPARRRTPTHSHHHSPRSHRGPASERRQKRPHHQRQPLQTQIGRASCRERV